MARKTELTLTFDTGNAAFDDGNGPAEAARILRKIAAAVADEYDEGVIHDANGNRVGDWSVTFPAPEED